MKRITLLLMAVLIVLALIGCATVKTGMQDPATLPEQASEAPEVPGTEATPGYEVSVPATNPDTPSDSYGVYVTVKSNAIQRISDKIEGNDELSLTVGLGMLPVTMIDLSLLPLSVLSMEGAESALAMFGMTTADISRNGNDYSITYSDREGKTFTQTCSYDPAADTLQSSVLEGGIETLFFEYVRVGNGYAAQYYYDNGDGKYKTITMFFNDTDTIAYGIMSSDEKPASIKGGSLTVDFVKNDESYCIMQGDALTVFDKGEAKSY